MKVMAVPRHLDIEITTKCNLRCSYCSHFSSEGDVAADLPKEAWFTFFEELKGFGLMDVTLSGGEPLSRKDIKDIILRIIECRMRFSILTNGTLITDDLAKFLRSTNRLDSIQVSIDGVSGDTHDVYRGVGSLDDALGGIRNLQKNDITPTVRVTLHDRNVDTIEDIAEFLLHSLQLPSFSTNAAFGTGMCKLGQDITLSTEQYSRAMQKLQKLSSRYPGRIHAQAGPLADARAWGAMQAAADTGAAPFDNSGKLTGCGCVFSKLAVRADGAIVPCNLMGGMVLGHINRDSLLDIWKNHRILQEFRGRNEIALSEFEFCNDCDFHQYCTGNYPALSVSKYGNPHLPSDEGCLRKFLEAGGVVPPFENNEKMQS
jgi:SynChlorMet cassette radical SAM/SPASM protein ScmE